MGGNAGRFEYRAGGTGSVGERLCRSRQWSASWGRGTASASGCRWRGQSFGAVLELEEKERALRCQNAQGPHTASHARGIEDFSDMGSVPVSICRRYGGLLRHGVGVMVRRPHEKAFADETLPGVSQRHASQRPGRPAQGDGALGLGKRTCTPTSILFFFSFIFFLFC